MERISYLKNNHTMFQPLQSESMGKVIKNLKQAIMSCFMTLMPYHMFSTVWFQTKEEFHNVN